MHWVISRVVCWWLYCSIYGWPSGIWLYEIAQNIIVMNITMAFSIKSLCTHAFVCMNHYTSFIMLHRNSLTLLANLLLHSKKALLTENSYTSSRIIKRISTCVSCYDLLLNPEKKLDISIWCVHEWKYIICYNRSTSPTSAWHTLQYPE